MQVWSLGWEDPLEEGTATHSSILAWKIPWTEEPGRPQSSGSLRVRRYWGDFSCMACKIKRLVHNQWRVKRVALSSEEGSALIGGSCPGCYQQGCILMEHVLNKRTITIIFQCIYMESRKVVLKNSFTGQQWRNRHRKQTHGHGERGGEGERYGKSNMETYITICKIDSQWEFAVWLRKLKQGLYINLEGWDGEGGGREVQKGRDICIPIADSGWGLTENNKIL